MPVIPGQPDAISVSIGDDPRKCESGTTRTTVRLARSQLTLWGSTAERRRLVEVLAADVGLVVVVASEPRVPVVERGGPGIAVPCHVEIFDRPGGDYARVIPVPVYGDGPGVFR